MTTEPTTTEPTPVTEPAEDVTGLKAARDRLLNEKKALKDKMAAMEAQLADLAAARQAAEEEDSIRKGDFEKVRARLLEDQTKTVSAKDAEIAKLRAALEKHTLEASLVRALAEHGGDPELLLPHMAARLKLVEKDGTYETVVFDRDGTELLGKGVTDLVVEYQEKFPAAFSVKAASPTGARPNTGIAQGEVNPWLDATWNRSAQARLTMSNPEKANLLKAQAGR